MGYLYAVLALVAFAVLGISYKLADTMRCDTRQANFFLFLSGAGFTLIWMIISHGSSFGAGGLAFGGVQGIAIFASVVAFRRALALGRISVSWTIINLALIAPVVASITIWHETPDLKHYLGFALTLTAIILLGIDMRRAGE